MKSIAIIPARSGSKGLKDKNIKILHGKPLLWYSVQAALKSKCFDEVMVSTDSNKYAQIAIECGASVPFLRSKYTSTDNASSWDSVKEVLDNYRKKDVFFENVMLLQPTSPLRTEEDIIAAFNIMINHNAKSVVSVCEADHSPLWFNTLPSNGCMKDFVRYDVDRSSGRQNLPKYYRVNGAIYLSKVSNKLGTDLYTDSGFAYIMPQDRSVDIDTEFDFKFAEFLMQNQ